MLACCLPRRYVKCKDGDGRAHILTPLHEDDAFGVFGRHPIPAVDIASLS
jgi:hypothetical protein